jgi:hypothetical protein
MANSSLYEAVEENDVGKAMELLQNGADVNSRGGVRVCSCMSLTLNLHDVTYIGTNLFIVK